MDSKQYKSGTVDFEPILHLRREFLHATESDTSLYTFSVGIDSYHKGTNKQGEETFTYGWDSSLIFKHENITIRLHSMCDDAGLFDFQKKMEMVDKALDEFIREVQVKVPPGTKRKPIKRRLWLNSVDSGQAGHILYSIDASGSGRFDIGDCHRTIVIWLTNYPDLEGTVVNHWEDHLYDKMNFEILCNLKTAVSQMIGFLEMARGNFESLIEKGKDPDGT